MKTALTEMTAAELRRELQTGDAPALRWRRAIVGASLVGMGAMGAVSLLQMGVIRHLPDPPLRGFDSDKVNSSDTAYALGVPDGTYEHAPRAQQLTEVGLTGQGIAARVRALAAEESLTHS